MTNTHERLLTQLVNQLRSLPLQRLEALSRLVAFWAQTARPKKSIPFSAVALDTRYIKFNRDEANAR
jgi:hypothetical protein